MSIRRWIPKPVLHCPGGRQKLPARVLPGGGKGRGCGRTVTPLTVALQRSAVGYPAYSRGRWGGGRFGLWEGSVLPNRPQMRNRGSFEDTKRHLLTSHHLSVPGIQHRDRCPLPRGPSFRPARLRAQSKSPDTFPYTSALFAKADSFSIFCAIS